MAGHKAEKNLTQAYVREALSYDPKTGEFVWLSDRVSVAGEIIAAKGDVAGCFDPTSGYRFIHFYEFGLLREHRLAWFWMTGEWPPLIDHIDGVGANNAWGNLRSASRLTNRENVRRVRSDNKCGFMGVHRHVSKTGLVRYVARITADKRPRVLGQFDTAEAAHHAYVAAKRELHAGCTI